VNELEVEPVEVIGYVPEKVKLEALIL